MSGRKRTEGARTLVDIERYEAVLRAMTPAERAAELDAAVNELVTHTEALAEGNTAWPD